MIIIFIVYVLPILWVISTSFKFERDALSIPPKIFFEPTLENYQKAFTKNGMSANFINSIIISVGSSLFGLILGIPAAYALSRFQFRQNSAVYMWFLGTRMAPPFLTVLPIFIISRQINLYDTIGLIIVVNMLMNISWVVWMMRSFFDEIPSEIDEACLVDGCNRFSTLFKVILPLAKPGIAATLIFCMIVSWNEYFFAMVLTSIKARTLPATLTTFISVFGLLWGQMCAAATVIMLPILIFTWFTQRYLIRGLTMGAVKG
jgi:ABC-type glycerol-3-phosphate transport system permease component